MKKQDDFTNGYLEAIFFTEDENLSDNLTIYSIEENNFQEIISLCNNFQKDNVALLEAANYKGYTDNQAGIDLWLTRNRHGAGFWDRGLGDIGTKLTEIAHSLKESDAYEGDDGKLYLTNTMPNTKNIKLKT